MEHLPSTIAMYELTSMQLFPTHGLDEGVPLNTLYVPRTWRPWTSFLWGYLKDKVYRNKPRTIDALKTEIERQCRDIPNDLFRDVCKSLGARYQRCLDKNGHQFEHLRTWFFNHICLLYSKLFHFTVCSEIKDFSSFEVWVHFLRHPVERTYTSYVPTLRV